MSIDTSQLDAFGRDLGRTGRRMTRNVQKDIRVTALDIKEDARRFATGISYAPSYPRSIDFELIFRLQEAAAKIGPDKNGPQGALGNILEYGTVNNGPRKHLGPALDRKAPRLEERLARSAADLW
jgi:hypothetical protein